MLTFDLGPKVKGQSSDMHFLLNISLNCQIETYVMLQTYRKSLMGFHFISWTLTLVQGQRSNRYFSGFDILQTITCHVLEIRTTITVKSSKQTSKQTSKHVNKHVNKQTCKQTNKQMNLWKADHRNPGLKAGRRPPEGIGGFQGGGGGRGVHQD